MSRFTYLALAGMTFAASGQFLLLLGVISIGASFVTGGLGVTPLLAWIGALAWLSLVKDALPHSIGWLALAVLGLTVTLVAVSGLRLRATTWLSAGLLLAVLSGWCGMVGAQLLQR